MGACLGRRRTGHRRLLAKKEVSAKGKIVIETVRRDEAFEAHLGRGEEMI